MSPELGLAIENALLVLDCSLEFNQSTAHKLISLSESLAKQQSALSAMLDFFYINRERLTQVKMMNEMLDTLKVAMNACSDIRDVVIEIGLELKNFSEALKDGTTN